MSGRYASYQNAFLLPNTNEVCEGYVFTGVCLSTPGGACMVLFGGHVWFYLAGGMRGFIWRGHAWFYLGGVHGFIRGHAWFYLGGHAWFYLGGRACVILFGGHACFIQGACMVLFGGHVWFYSGGGMRGFFSFFGYNKIRSMSGRYASYWNAFLFLHEYYRNTPGFSASVIFLFRSFVSRSPPGSSIAMETKHLRVLLHLDVSSLCVRQHSNPAHNHPHPPIPPKQECIPVGCVPVARRPYAGVCFPGGVCLVPGGSAWSGGSGIPACTEADTLPPVDRHTPVKTLPWPQLRCGR